MNKKIIFFGLAGLLASLLSTSAHAVASMSFSGGNGSQVVFTLNQPVEYTITTTSAVEAPIFAFRGVGDLFAATWPAVSGSMTYSVNGGSPLTLETVNSGFDNSDVLATDLYFYGPNIYDPIGWLEAGDVVTLWSGELTTTDSFAFAPPTGGEFSTFIFENWPNLNRISTYGVSVSPIPEPETYALMLAGLGLVGFMARRRKAK